MKENRVEIKNGMCEKAPVTVIIITLNEERNIGDCLKSIYNWTDDIIIVDSYSEDATVEIAKKYTSKIYFVERGHWARIRNWALKNLPIKYDWVLFLDADERLTDELKNEIKELLCSDKEIEEVGLYIKRRFIFLGKWLKHGGLYTPVLRLFKKDKVHYLEMGDSEYAVVEGKVGVLKNDMIHEDKKGIDEWVKKHLKIADLEANRYLNLKETVKQIIGKERESKRIEGGLRTFIKYKIFDKIPLFFKPFILFIYTYFLKLGFLDGKEGLIYHLLWAFWYRLIIYVKVKEKIIYRATSRRNHLKGS
jgi:glycosyltransferase involved in cell wall biosynthesis